MQRRFRIRYKLARWLPLNHCRDSIGIILTMFNAVLFGCFLSIASAKIATFLQPQDGVDANRQMSVESPISPAIDVADPMYLYIHSSRDIDTILEHLNEIFQDLNIKDLKQWHQREVKPIGLVLRIPVIKGQEHRYTPLLERYGVSPAMKKIGTKEESIMTKWNATTPDFATNFLSNEDITERPIPVEGTSKPPAIRAVEDDDPVVQVETVTIQNANEPFVEVRLSNPEITDYMKNDEWSDQTFSGNLQAVSNIGKEQVSLPNVVRTTPRPIYPDEEENLVVRGVEFIKEGGVTLPSIVYPTVPPRAENSSIEETTASTISKLHAWEGDQVEVGVPTTPSVGPASPANAGPVSTPGLAPPSSNLILPQTPISPTKRLYSTNEKLSRAPNPEVPEWMYTNALYSQLRYSLAQLYQLFPYIAKMAGYTKSSDCLSKRPTSDFYSEISLKDWVTILRKVEAQNWDVMETRQIQFGNDGDIVSSY